MPARTIKAGLPVNMGYVLHDFDMAIYAAMLAGSEGKARGYFQQMMSHIKTPAMHQGTEVFHALEFDILVRFGRC